MEAIFECLADGVILVDALGTIRDANPAATLLLGYGRDELLGMEVDALHVDERRAKECRERLASALVRGDTARCSFSLRRKGGAEIAGEQSVSRVELGGEPFAVVLLRDLSPVIAAEAQWRRIAESLPDFVVLLDADHRIVWINRTYANLDRAEVIGSEATAWTPEHVRAPMRAALERAVTTSTAVEHEIEAVGPDDGVAWYRLRIVPLGQKPDAYVLLVASDITEHKRVEQELRDSERSAAERYERERSIVLELRALDEAKNAFLTAVSHELRTPLTAVRGLAQTLERVDDRLSHDERTDLVRRISSKARRLDRLLSDLLDLDRLRSGVITAIRRPTDIASLVRHVVDDVDGLSDRVVTVDADGVVFDVDGPKLERIVENLLINIVRYTPPGTRVDVRARIRDDMLVLSVEDDGPGVPDELKDAVFEPFRQGDVPGHSPGVGIGLSIVARFAWLHGGRAWVEDREGGGAAFRVVLPGA